MCHCEEGVDCRPTKQSSDVSRDCFGLRPRNDTNNKRNSSPTTRQPVKNYIGGLKNCGWKYWTRSQSEIPRITCDTIVSIQTFFPSLRPNHPNPSAGYTTIFATTQLRTAYTIRESSV